jgi:hypothetical protein
MLGRAFRRTELVGWRCKFAAPQKSIVFAEHLPPGKGQLLLPLAPLDAMNRTESRG